MAHVEADAFNAATHHARMASMLEREVARLHDVIAALEAAQGWDCANAPLFRTI